MMKQLVFIFLSITNIICFSQKTKTTSGKIVAADPVKPAAAANTNIVGSYFINYEIKNGTSPAKTGKVFYALDNNQVVISPSTTNLKDVTNLRMLIDLKESEMTMLTIDIKNKKNGLLTKLPKPILNKTTASKKPAVVTKTGIYKTIQGFKCEKTLVNIGDSVNIEAYITTEIIIDVANAIILSNNSLRSKSPFTTLNFDVKGTVLESISTKINGEIIKLTITDIRKGKADPAAFNSNGYNIMDARGLPMFNNAN